MASDKLLVRKSRIALEGDNDTIREAVKNELMCLAASELTDVLFWDEAGRVTLTKPEDLSVRVRKAIKKVKITPGRSGTTVEVEMHDKVAPLRLLAKPTGMLDGTMEQNKPSIIGINVKGAKVTDYEVLDEQEAEIRSSAPREDPALDSGDSPEPESGT